LGRSAGKGVSHCDAEMGGWRVGVRVVAPIGVIVLVSSGAAVDQPPQEWQGALDLRRAVTIKSDHVHSRPRSGSRAAARSTRKRQLGMGLRGLFFWSA
jgi:hypothetical protein